MKEKKIEIEDVQLRELFQKTGKKAPENLQYRIMHQIETESALTRKKASPAKRGMTLLKDLRNIFGTMYILLAAIVGGSYLLLGEEFLKSPHFWGTVILVSVIFSSLWMITRIDCYVREKKK
ncbi:MAG TPA: hypothetical protein PLH60_00810 [Proteiniphilum sp.]|nr:hypothetical protein [Proteiniphilum sp.]HPJ50074.1 hypothetical protein [Proteiniphilum sp.]HPR19082.1 hypothetical protein [Proteiniphilum sp.]